MYICKYKEPKKILEVQWENQIREEKAVIKNHAEFGRKYEKDFMNCMQICALLVFVCEWVWVKVSVRVYGFVWVGGRIYICVCMWVCANLSMWASVCGWCICLWLMREWVKKSESESEKEREAEGILNIFLLSSNPGVVPHLLSKPGYDGEWGSFESAPLLGDILPRRSHFCWTINWVIH